MCVLSFIIEPWVVIRRDRAGSWSKMFGSSRCLIPAGPFVGVIWEVVGLA